MVKRYYKKEQLSIKNVEIFECPDCGFEFNAMHEVDEQVGGWECPLCEVDELKQEIEQLKRDKRALAKVISADVKHSKVEQKTNNPVGIKCKCCGKTYRYTSMCPYCDEGRMGN